jgi:hypothetical protein
LPNFDVDQLLRRFYRMGPQPNRWREADPDYSEGAQRRAFVGGRVFGKLGIGIAAGLVGTVVLLFVNYGDSLLNTLNYHRARLSQVRAFEVSALPVNFSSCSIQCSLPNGRPVVSDWRRLLDAVSSSGVPSRVAKSPKRSRIGATLYQFLVLAREMGGDTRPAPVLCLQHKLASYGIEKNVTYRMEQMRFMHHDRSKAPLP